MRFERRSAVRYSLTFPALIKWAAPNAGTRIRELQTTNISVQGAFFETPIPLPPNAKVVVDLISRSKPPPAALKTAASSFISIAGWVVRQEPNGMAVAFSPDYSITALQDRLGVLRKQLDWIQRHQDRHWNGELYLVS